MPRPVAPTPASSLDERRGRQGVIARQLDAPRTTPSESFAQHDFVTLVVANRYGLAPHVARVGCELAGLGASTTA